MIKHVVEKDIDLIIKKTVQQSGKLLDKLAEYAGLVNVKLCYCDISQFERDLGETDIKIIVEDEYGNRYALLIEDKINAPSQSMQYERYIARGEKGISENEYSDYFIYMIAPKLYLDVDEMGRKYNNKSLL